MFKKIYGRIAKDYDDRKELNELVELKKLVIRKTDTFCFCLLLTFTLVMMSINHYQLQIQYPERIARH